MVQLSSEPTRSLVAKFLHIRSSLEYANFVLQGKNAVNEATDACVPTFEV